MKMIKFITTGGQEFYVNTNFIQGVSGINGVTDYSTIVVDNEPVQVKGTPEQIVAMIHEAEGNK
jgi:hypothetical protein|nr:MAG TPA: Flagellar and Swarming motility protein [Caudoviricetes sp.]